MLGMLKIGRCGMILPYYLRPLGSIEKMVHTKSIVPTLFERNNIRNKERNYSDKVS